MYKDGAHLVQRRQQLAARRANLATARSLLANLEAAVPSASSLSLPQSVSALQARCTALELVLDSLELEANQTRAILAREIVAVYALRRIVVELPLPDPFLTAPLADSVTTTSTTSATAAAASPLTDSASTVATLRTRAAPAPIPPTYVLASLPLPTLAQLVAPTRSSSLASQAHVEAILSHLVHLVRLLALYEGVSLPFTPLPSCFGPGRAGVRVAVGWGGPSPRPQGVDAQGGLATATPRRDATERSSSSGDRRTPTPRDCASSGPTLTISDGDCFPLCYPSRSSTRRTQRSDSDRNSHGEGEEDAWHGEPAVTTTTDEGSDPGHPPSPATTTSRAGVFGGGGRAMLLRRRRRQSRVKGVLLGAVAIAYDLAYLAWQREQRVLASRPRPLLPAWSGHTDWHAPEVLDDLGELLMRAAGVAPPSQAASALRSDSR